jgi:uncharacterized membrane protein
MADEQQSRLAPDGAANRAPLYLTSDGRPIAPWRRSLDRAGSSAIDWLAIALPRHWLLAANVAVGLYALLPVLAPLMLAGGLTAPALAIYRVYSYLCHQLPERSWFILGQKMAYCQRDAAIYPMILLAGLVYGWRSRSVPTLTLKWYLILIAPMAIDGFTQLFGLRESTGALRTVTGALFGVASVWFFYPRVQRVIDEEFGGGTETLRAGTRVERAR